MLIYCCACSNTQSKTDSLEKKIDSLQSRLAHMYIPGVGEFMSSIQIHHEKLWFAGVHQNWKLADFELHELGEAFEGVRTFGDDTLILQILPMVDTLLAGIKSSVAAQDGDEFRRQYELLTNGCNNCHRATKHEFNTIVTPATPPFTDQVFEPSSP